VKETQESICQWADDTFGPVKSTVRVAIRSNEEMSELLRALSADDDLKALEEVADVVIVLYRVAEMLGGNLHVEVDRKMAINRARRWNLTGDGHGYHVRDKAVYP
jgi:NTP pyrophosphatase (non-canonical NTP hydrolase)